MSEVPTTEDLDASMREYWDNIQARSREVPSGIPNPPQIVIETQMLEKREESAPDLPIDKIVKIQS